MKLTTLLLLVTLFCVTTSCKKDDDNNDPDCVKEENYFTAEFDGQILEPYWRTGFGTTRYTFGVNRDNQYNAWVLSVRIEEPDIYIYIWIIDVNGVGFYPIEYVTYDDLMPPLYQKNYVQIEYTDIIADDGYPFMYLSMENTSGIDITSYDSSKGVLVGTFTCGLYAPSNPNDIKQISGEFNINMTTYDPYTKPCWL